MKCTLCLKEKGAPGKQGEGVIPWFDYESKDKDLKIIFGHWSTLGKVEHKNIYPLDTGCVWGGKLTALRIDKKKPEYISLKCKAHANPADFI